jgi:hypothetical protein
VDDGGGDVDHGGEALVGLVRAHDDALEFLELAEEVLDKVAPFVEIGVDVERLNALRPLGDDDLRSALVQLRDDPV